MPFIFKTIDRVQDSGTNDNYISMVSGSIFVILTFLIYMVSGSIFLILTFLTYSI